MLGLVLCGGQSSRMGTDKGLLQSSGKIFAQSAIEKLHSLDLDVRLSINVNQAEAYSLFFDSSKLIVDDLQLEVKGPLLGILSCHRENSTEDLLVLACDLPLMNTAPLYQLMREYIDNPGYDAYVFNHNGHAEPLCGLYTAKGLREIYARTQSGNYSKFSMKFALEQMNTCFLELSSQQEKYFKNVNRPEDL